MSKNKKKSNTDISKVVKGAIESVKQNESLVRAKSFLACHPELAGRLKILAQIGIAFPLLYVALRLAVRFTKLAFALKPTLTMAAVALVLVIAYKILDPAEQEAPAPQLTDSDRMKVYNHLRTAMFQIFTDLTTVLGILPPNSYNAIETPERIREIKQIPHFEFIASVRDININPVTAQRIIEDKLNTLARSGALSGLVTTKDILVNGNLYPPLKVHSCETIGKYLFISIVVVSQKYIEQIAESRRMDIANNITSNIFDDDFNEVGDDNGKNS